jgi:ankyrin repeat protein
MRYAGFLNRASVYLTIFVVTQLFSDGLSQLETTLHSQDKDDEKMKRGMNKKGDEKGIPLSESSFNYSVSYWLKHAIETRHRIEDTSLSKELWELVRDFFWDQGGEFFTEWVRVFASGSDSWHTKSVPSRSLHKPLSSYLEKSRVTGTNVAASYGLVDIIEWAHPDGIDFDVLDKWRYTPLIEAAGTGEDDVVRILLFKHSARINQMTCYPPTTEHCSGSDCTKSGTTALMDAAMFRNFGVMQLLLGHPDIEVDLISHRTTVLGEAIVEGSSEVAKLLVDAGAKLAMKNGNVLEIPSYS